MATFTRTTEVIRSGIDEKLHLGAQLHIARNGETLFDDGIGEAHPGSPMTGDSINLWWSSVKPVAAVAIAKLKERAQLQYDDPVAKYIREFAHNEKNFITIRQLLTHTAGIRAWPIGLGLTAPWSEIVAKLAAMKIEPRWEPGEKAGYHGRTAWFLLAEIVQRIDGRSYDRFVRDEIFVPLGMNDSWLSVPPDVYQGYVAQNRLSVMCEFDQPDTPCMLPTAAECANLHPGGSGRGPIRELGRFYEMLRNRGAISDARVLNPGTVVDLVKPHRVGMVDQTFKYRMDWGLGFILNTQRDPQMPYGYGQHASAQTFGHSGSKSSCAFCDSAHGLVVAWVCNGMPSEPQHQARQRAINDAIYEDLGIS
jgi:CubicO group peptidase (beta-lactamase class C family)